MRWLTNFYNLSFKWSATTGIGIHPIKPCLSQLVNFKNAIWTLEERYAIKFCFYSLSLEKMPCDESWIYRDQEIEFPVEAYWLSQTQEGETEQIHPQTFSLQHWHDQHALGSHWIDIQGILCWGFKGVQEEIPSEKASTLQIGSVAFQPGQCTCRQLHPCHRLFDQDGYQHSSSSSL